MKIWSTEMQVLNQQTKESKTITDQFTYPKRKKHGKQPRNL